MSTNGDTLTTGSIWQQAWNAISGLLRNNQAQLVNILRTPTPVKVSRSFLIDPSGCIGAGLAQPMPHTIYQCPMSAEAWVTRITVTSPEHSPNNALVQGEIMVTGSTSGEVIFFLPLSGAIAPVQITEGRLSAPHLNPGEQMWIVGDQLPAGHHIRVDLQVMLVQGVSEYTPPKFAPGEVGSETELIA